MCLITRFATVMPSCMYTDTIIQKQHKLHHIKLIFCSFHSVLWLLVGWQKGIRPVKSCVLVCWWWWFDRSFAHPTAPAVTTTFINLSSNKIQNVDILVPAYPSCPGKWPLSECRRCPLLFLLLSLLLQLLNYCFWYDKQLILGEIRLGPKESLQIIAAGFLQPRSLLCTTTNVKALNDYIKLITSVVTIYPL